MCGAQHGHDPRRQRGAHPPTTGEPGTPLTRDRRKRVNLACLEVYIFRFQMLAVTMPILATNLFPGIGGKQIGTLPPCHSDFHWHASTLPGSGPFPHPSVGTDLERVKCNFLATLYKWPACVIWFPLSLLTCSIIARLLLQHHSGI